MQNRIFNADLENAGMVENYTANLNFMADGDAGFDYIFGIDPDITIPTKPAISQEQADVVAENIKALLVFPTLATPAETEAKKLFRRDLANKLKERLKYYGFIIKNGVAETTKYDFLKTRTDILKLKTTDSVDIREAKYILYKVGGGTLAITDAKETMKPEVQTEIDKLIDADINGSKTFNDGQKSLHSKYDALKLRNDYLKI
ncbi:MAG: hypothetical protein Q7R95_04820, partial [bacterium]|nr:hypothetical protein [bacterium]